MDTVVLFEKLAAAVGAELAAAVGENLSVNRSIATLLRDGHAVIRRAGRLPRTSQPRTSPRR